MDLIRYGYKGNLLTILQDDRGNPWWLAGEICDVLGFRMASDATRLLDDDEKGTHNLRTPGGLQEVTIVNEPGLYALIFKSRKPEAKTFKRWVTHEVLPSIRKTGAYHHCDPEEAPSPHRKKGHHEDTADGYGDILKEQRQLHQLFEHAYKIAKRMTSSGREASLMAQAKVEELTGINLAESYRLPPGMKAQAETDRETVDAFVHDCCLVGDGYQVPATELYQAFRNWFDHNRSGEVPSRNWFGRRMGLRFRRKKAGTFIRKTRPIIYRGVDLKRTITDDGYVRDFIDECCSLGEEFKTALHVIYERFSDFYLKHTGEVPLPVDRFAGVLSRYFSIDPDEENILAGIGLLSAAPADA
ncbi:BRO family protein [uncultured Desulfosarcina sp.]|uniref:BRO-N domain-containing protein n=1 Tax=uncultured Desulfosarcina sp. TaxID=218289 RepID=UPI0029C7AA3B|nr:BRO family protein [uncultured Desulfosarcina sp.]